MTHYDLCVIGSGSGLAVMPPEVTERWSTVLIDAGIGPTDAFGGTCLNAGCIPSKMFAAAANSADSPRRSELMDVSLTSNGVDFAALQARTFGRTDSISESGLAWQHTRDNVTVLRGSAEFVGDHELRVGRDTFTADRIVLAAGSRPRPVRANGFDDAMLAPFVHTSESIMRLPEVPKKLVILGGGVEAVEFAHIFSAFGSQVTVINRSATLLKKLDPDVAAAMTQSLGDEVSLRLNQQVTGIEPAAEGGVVVLSRDEDAIIYSYEADVVLSVIGRVPNSDVLHVERTGVDVDEHGFVKVDEHQRTSADKIWALGDINNPQMLKHVANRQSKVVLSEFLAELDGHEPMTFDSRAIPAGIFADPEIAWVGATCAELDEEGVSYVVHRQDYMSTAYGWALNAEDHFVKLIGSRDGKLLGAHIVGPQATTLIQPLIMAMQFDMDLRQVAAGQFWIHPALTEVVENALLGLIEATGLLGEASE